jgi:D-beta-D-heptose 7-phosphate kinase/D-beta-D-heptose 1-phosphate adenosyltransferase
MTSDLIQRVESLGHPRILVLGDLILDRYVWGQAERISQEAPVPLFRADRREHRLGGASSVATMLRSLEASVSLVGVIGQDPEADLVRALLEQFQIDQQLVIPLDDRPTTLKERYIGRASDRHPQQMIRVDYEERRPIPTQVENLLIDHLPAALKSVDMVLVSDYDKGVCTPRLLDHLIRQANHLDLKVLVDPIRGRDYSRYRGVACMTPNRLEASLATGIAIDRPEDALDAGRSLVRDLNLECALVTLDRDGMALVRSDGHAELVPTRARQVYDITGAGDMVLSVVGLCLAAGGDYLEAARLGNVAGGLEVERIGVALLSREEILRDLMDHDRTLSGKQFDRQVLALEVARRRRLGQKIVFTNGCFDLLHVGHARLLRAAAHQGDFLVVGLNSNASVKRLKGENRPIVSEDDRAEMLCALESVDAVVLFDEDTPRELILQLRPDVLVKGGDYEPEHVVGRQEVESWGGKLVLIPLVQGRSTSALERQLALRGITRHEPSATPTPHLDPRKEPDATPQIHSRHASPEK